MKGTKNLKAKSQCIGLFSILEPIKQELLQYIFKLREQGMGVSTVMVMLKASSLLKNSHDKSRIAQYNAPRHFIMSHGLVHQIATYESQRDPKEMESESLDFVQNVRPKLTQPCRHDDFIRIMNQTPVPFTTYNSKKTLKLVGKKTVHVRKSTNVTKRATFAMSVTASRKVLKPLLVFKG